MAKEKYVRARVNLKIKEAFEKKLEEDGISETDFIMACIMNYLDIKTCPEDLKGSSESRKG